MLLSQTHHFIFVHVPKTAGSSVHNLLKPYAVKPQRTLLRSAIRRLPLRLAAHQAHFRLHEPAAHIRATLGAQEYERFHSFAVVRNPFDHAVSHFEYLKQYRSERIARQFENIEFRSYLKMRCSLRMSWHRIFVHLPDQAYFVVNKRSELLVKQIIHFEDLRKEIPALQERLGLDVTPLTKRNETKSKKRKAKTLADYYGPEEIELVRRLYKRDFDLFGYAETLPP